LAGNAFNPVNRKIIADLAAATKLAAMSTWREATQAGFLMSYGYVRTDQFRNSAIYVAKILRGANPADLPVEAPTRYELVINLSTAKALNLEIPRSMLGVADELIE
jgi:putative ABC transport system substrate-binding protein